MAWENEGWKCFKGRREVAVKGQSMLLVVFELAEQDAVTDALFGDATRGDTRLLLPSNHYAPGRRSAVVKVGLTVPDRSTRLTCVCYPDCTTHQTRNLGGRNVNACCFLAARS
jgi:hypothetical protein